MTSGDETTNRSFDSIRFSSFDSACFSSSCRVMREAIERFEELQRRQLNEKKRFLASSNYVCRLCFKTKFVEKMARVCNSCGYKICSRCGLYSHDLTGCKQEVGIQVCIQHFSFGRQNIFTKILPWRLILTCIYFVTNAAAIVRPMGVTQFSFQNNFLKKMFPSMGKGGQPPSCIGFWFSILDC